MRATMALKKYHRDEPLIAVLGSVLINTHLLSQVVPQICCRVSEELASNLWRMRACQFSTERGHLGLDTDLVFLNWNKKVAFWHNLLLNMSFAFLYWDVEVAFWRGLRVNTGLAFLKRNVNVMFWCSQWLRRPLAQWHTTHEHEHHVLAYKRESKLSFAFSTNNTVFSFYCFCLLTASSTSSSTNSIVISSQRLLWTSCKLNL